MGFFRLEGFDSYKRPGRSKSENMAVVYVYAPSTQLFLRRKAFTKWERLPSVIAFFFPTVGWFRPTIGVIAIVGSGSVPRFGAE